MKLVVLHMERNECSEILTKLANTKINSIMKISKKNQEILNFLNCREIESLNYEGVVGVSVDYSIINTINYCVIQDGKIIDYLETNEKIENLWEEYMFTEGQYN
jgi:hypothetical protein